MGSLLIAEFIHNIGVYMMLQQKFLAVDSIRGVIYDFPEVGDVLPKHTHTEDDVHITICARGKLEVFSNQWKFVISAGDVWDWDPGVYHGFRALEPNSRIINIIKAYSTPDTLINYNLDH